MSDTKESMPAQPKTVELPAVTDRALLEDLTRTVKAGFANVETTLLDFGERLVRVEIRQKDLEEQRVLDNIRNSQRVKEPSQHDLETAKALAQEVVARESLAKKVDGVEQKVVSIETKTDTQTEMLGRIEKRATDILSSPKVKALGWALWLALGAWLASKGIKVGP